MSKILLVICLGLLAAILAVAAAPQGTSQTNDTSQSTCSPWLGLCHTSSDCCRYLVCLSYNAKCMPKEGLKIPGQDTRPIGPPPYPPGNPEVTIR